MKLTAFVVAATSEVYNRFIRQHDLDRRAYLDVAAHRADEQIRGIAYGMPTILLNPQLENWGSAGSIKRILDARLVQYYRCESGDDNMKNEWVLDAQYKLIMKSITFEGVLVHVFRADEAPDPILVGYYYGQKVPENAFRTLKVDRAVLKRDDGSYWIVPIAPTVMVLRRVGG